MCDPDIPPVTDMNADQYKNNVGTIVNHFYEKLFLIKDMMNTETGKDLAVARDKYMHGFLEEFYAEWEE